MDMVMLTVDLGVVVLSPHLVSYGFVRYLKERGIRIVEVPVEEYWDLAVNGVTLQPGKVVANRGSPTVVEALEKEGIEVIQVDFSESQRFAALRPLRPALPVRGGGSAAAAARTPSRR